jgi:hypothetical protein
MAVLDADTDESEDGRKVRLGISIFLLRDPTADLSFDRKYIRSTDDDDDYDR